MVNEERLHHMIKMAIFDTNQGKECKPMTQYARKDYVSLRMLGSFVSGTIGFALILVTWGIYSMNQLMENLNAMDIQELLTSVLVKYIVFMIAGAVDSVCSRLFNLSNTWNCHWCLVQLRIAKVKITFCLCENSTW